MYRMGVKHTLQALGYSTQNATPETILQAPWSSVYRFSTRQGDFYLKKVPPALSLEVQVMRRVLNSGLDHIA